MPKLNTQNCSLDVPRYLWKKFTSFCQVLKEMHTKENWFLFSASPCSMRSRVYETETSHNTFITRHITVILIIIIIISFPSPPHSFIPRIKPSFSANHSHRSLSFSSSGLTTWIPQTLTVTSEHIHFYFLVFFCFTLLVVVSVRSIKLTHVGFRAHVKIASRIV